MPAAIGMRVYMVTLHKRGAAAPVPFEDTGAGATVPDFIEVFKTAHLASVQDADRSWYLEERETDGLGSSKGYVHYGMSGFESRIIDSKTKKKKYERQVTDSEEVPLFYEFWYPPDKQDYVLVLFQSFQGRSCITMMCKTFREEFESSHPDYTVRFKKLISGDTNSGIFSSALVKRLTLIRRNASGDLATQYIGSTPESVDFQLSITSRPRKSLGSFADLLKSVKKPDGVVIFDGISFEEAAADVRIGKRVRRVGVFGGNSEAGVIDITDDVVTGSNGHPSYKSLVGEANDILVEFHSVMSGN